MAFSSLPSSNVPSRTVPNLISGDRRGWFAQDSRPLIDWDQARMMRRVGLYSPPSSASPHPEAHTFPRWPCLLCNIKLKSAEGVSRHIEIAHGQCDEFFRRTTEFCTRCTICYRIHATLADLMTHVASFHPSQIPVIREILQKKDEDFMDPRFKELFRKLAEIRNTS